MNSTRMRRLHDALEHIASQPSSNQWSFDMGEWMRIKPSFDTRLDLPNLDADDAATVISECGTSACAAGWAILLAGLEAESMAETPVIASAWLGLSPAEGYAFFMGMWINMPLKNVSADLTVQFIAEWLSNPSYEMPYLNVSYDEYETHGVDVEWGIIDVSEEAEAAAFLEWQCQYEALVLRGASIRLANPTV